MVIWLSFLYAKAMKDFNYNAVPLKKRRYYISGKVSLATTFIILILLSAGVFSRGNPALAAITLASPAILYYATLQRDFLVRFATENNLSIINYPAIKYTEVPFMNKIYNRVTLSKAIVLHAHAPYVELFDYTKSLSKPPKSIGEFLVLHIKLKNNLPNIILDASQNDKFLGTDIPVDFQDFTKEYVLEGHFPDYFRVFAHDAASIETLQLLSPDLMIKLIDQLPNFNMEFINQSVFITCRAKLITRSSFQQFIESGLQIADDLQVKSQKILRVNDVYGDRITKH